MTNEALIRTLKELKKRALLIIPTDPSEIELKKTDTKFGGAPYAETGDKCPICAACGEKLTFVFQFRDNYDMDLKPSGPLHVFYYCFGCMPIETADEGQWLVKTYKNPESAKFVETSPNETMEIVPSGVTLKRDFVVPAFDFMCELNSEVYDLCTELSPDDPHTAYEEAAKAAGAIAPVCSSMGGYQAVVQALAAQDCPHCSKDMDFFVQIQSEEDINLMWGDLGVLYLFKCHTDGSFGMEMQCY